MKNHINLITNISTLSLAALANDITQIVLLVLGITSTAISIGNTIYKNIQEVKKKQKSTEEALDTIEQKIKEELENQEKEKKKHGS